MTDERKRYIGDGVYASFDGYHVWLTTENSGESDYGCWWTEPTITWPKHRVSLVANTGELYVVTLTAAFTRAGGHRDGVAVTNRIALDPPVLAALRRYVEELEAEQEVGT